MIEAFVPEDALDTIIPLLFAALVGCFIAVIYLLVRKQRSGDIRIANACVILTVSLCLITRVVDDLAAAFIVVGALTLIRLRAAIEDTREFGFLLLSVAAGLGTGERRYAIVLAGVTLVCVLALLLSPRADEEVEHRLSAVLPEPNIGEIRAAIAALCPGCRWRLRDMGEGKSSLRIEFAGKPGLADDLIARLRALPGVQDLRYEVEPGREA